MKENRLISMVEYIKCIKFAPPKHEDSYDYKQNPFGYKYSYICQYSDFLTQTLNISMFVPAVFDGGKWVVLEEPKVDKHNDDWFSDAEEFEQAKDKVIFEGFEVVKSMYKQTERVFVVNRSGLVANRKLIFHSGKVEDNFLFKDLTTQDLIKHNPTLTKYGQQQSGLCNGMKEESKQ